jgi:hypothetical protein
MSGARFVCSDPDAGDFEFADVGSVLDALEATLVGPATPLFDAARQSWQPLGMHAEIRAAWADRLRFRPPDTGLRLPEMPSLTALARSLPPDEDERENRREAFSRVRSQPPPVEVGTGPRDEVPRFATLGIAWVVLVIAVLAWLVLTLASGVSELAAHAAGVHD